MAATTDHPPPPQPSSYPRGQTASNPSFAFAIPQTEQTNYAAASLSLASMETPRTDNSCATPCVRRLILALLLLFAMITIVSMIPWLMLQPRVPNFRVDSLSVSKFNLTTSQLTVDFGIKFTVENPNRKIDLKLDDFKISVFHNREKLLEKSWNHYLCMRNMSQTGVSIEFRNSSDNYPIKQKTAIDMSRERRESVVHLKVKMEIWAKFEAGEWLSKQKFVEVCCDKLEVGFFPSSNVTAGTLMNGRKDCSARLG